MHASVTCQSDGVSVPFPAKVFQCGTSRLCTVGPMRLTCVKMLQQSVHLSVRPHYQSAVHKLSELNDFCDERSHVVSPTRQESHRQAGKRLAKLLASAHDGPTPRCDCPLPQRPRALTSDPLRSCQGSMQRLLPWLSEFDLR